MTSFQIRQAHEAAMRVKRARFNWRSEARALPLDEGRALIADLILTNPPELGTAFVSEVLRWARNNRSGATGNGRGSLSDQADAFMDASRIGLTATVGVLTPRQRDALARCLRGEMEDVRFEAERIFGEAA